MSKSNAHNNDPVTRELDRVVERIRIDLDRVEILSAALIAFNKPIPEYEAAFQNMPRMRLRAHELP